MNYICNIINGSQELIIRSMQKKKKEVVWWEILASKSVDCQSEDITYLPIGVTYL